MQRRIRIQWFGHFPFLPESRPYAGQRRNATEANITPFRPSAAKSNAFETYNLE
jgi:hypothetical protein